MRRFLLTVVALWTTLASMAQELPPDSIHVDPRLLEMVVITATRTP